MAGLNSLELEIHNLFLEGGSLEAICNEVIAKYEKSDVISPSESESISHFLITAGRNDLLFKFYLRGLRKNSLTVIPWGYLADAILQTTDELPEELLEIIEWSFETVETETSSTKSNYLVQNIPLLQTKLHDLNKKFELDKLQLKTKLMAQLNHNRLYQLAEQEEQTLQQLVRIFPTDIDVQLLHQAHLEKKADEILARIKNPHNRNFISRRPSVEEDPQAIQFVQQLENHLLELAEKLKTTSADQIYNLAVLAMHFELYELSLQLLKIAPATYAGEWLKAEMMFEAGRHLDLLKHLEIIAQHPANSAEATYGVVYLKAQAYFGLGQKEIAIRLLESLSDKVPGYRSTQALLHEWKNS